jgi:serine/threonine protein kinase
MQLEQIGKYRVLAKIGQGAMGEVHKGHDPFLNRFVAIKTITASLGADQEIRQRFLREAQSAARLNHPNIITVYDFGEEHGVIYMAMELLEGRDLKDLIVGQATGDLHQKLDIMEQISAGMAFAHANDLVHRDLKPANIHIQPGGDVKILDFGLARFSTSEMTRTGMVMGTPHYMSPEQVRGEKVDARSDTFSLGAVFYELLSGHRPFDGDSMHTVLFHVLQDEPEPLRSWVDVPPILVELVERALVKDPARRFQHAGQLWEAVLAVRRVMAEQREGEATLESELGPWTAESTLVIDATGRPATASPSSSGGRVIGAVALDTMRAAETAPERTRRAPPTLSGRSSTNVGSRRRSPPRSRWPIYAGAALGLVALTAGYWVLARTPPSAAGPATPQPGQERIGVLTEALVANQVQLARKKLTDKNYAAAASQAERALRLDKQSPEAKQILERAQQALKDLEDAAAEGREQLKAGDLDKASEALWRVLLADPGHASVGELAGPLDRTFQGRAGEARRLMAESRTAAERGKAGSLDAFSEAAGRVKEAEALFTKGAYAQAARRFLEARDGFDRARTLAQR